MTGTALGRSLPGWMYWKLIDAREYRNLPVDYLLTWAGRHEVTFALQRDGRLHALSQAPDSDGPDAAFPCAIFTMDELTDVPAWDSLLRFCPAHRVDLAVYQARHPEVPAETLLKATGAKVNFKSLSDWRELGALDESSQNLARKFELPLNVLRLWARLDPAERQSWLALWAELPFNKNFIRDIILDLYDLPVGQRTRALEQARDHAEHWQSRKHTRAYPAQEVRDMVRELRSPAIEGLRRQLLQLRRELGLPKNMQVDLPVDLEQRRLNLQVQFSDLSELRESLQQASSAGFQDTAQKILDRL